MAIILKLLLSTVLVGLVAAQELLRDRTPPVIDIGPLIRPDLHTVDEITRVHNAIRDAGGTWGFFQVLNHGIPQELQEQIMQQMKTFFHSPQDVKYSIKRTENNSRGFADDELTKRLKDAKEIVDIGQVPYTDLSEGALANQALDGMNQWPSEERAHLQQFRPVAEQYYDACLQLSRVLARALAAAIPCANATYFDKAFDRHSSFLRLNYYPALTDGVDAGAIPDNAPAQQSSESLQSESPPRRLGVSRHTDAGALTVLLQDWNPDVTSGLEVYSGSKEDNGDGEWVPVRPVPGSLTINTGDMMQVWSNGLLKAPEHRVRPTMEAHRVRYSAPFFYNPNYDTMVTPLPGTCDGSTRDPSEDQGNVGADSSTAVIDTAGEPQQSQGTPAVRAPRYSAIRWGDYRNMRFQGDFKDVGEEVQIEHFQARA